MKHFKSSLTKLAAVGSVVGFTACGGSNQTQANAPSPSQTATSDQHGSAMGQPGGSGEVGMQEGAPTGTQNAPQSGPGTQAGSGSTTSGEPGNPYGTTGGSQTGGTGNTAPATIGSPGSTSVMGGSVDTSGLSDGQFAGVLQAINQAQIQQALLAQSKASSPEVKRFAHQMVTAYRGVQTKESALFSRLQISPAESSVGTQMRTDAQNDLSTLQSMRGKDFDRSYMDAEVRHLNNVMELVDHMMHDAKSPELKAELQNVHTKVDTHLRDAERIQQSLQTEKTSP